MSYKFNPEKTLLSAKRFINGKLLETGLEGYVIGLSGGIDSALSAYLAVEAVGASRVLALLLPYKTSSNHSTGDALELIDILGITFQQIDISPMIDAYYQKIDDENRLRAGNKMARERMSILFDMAQVTKCLVLGTGNRTEICLGYTTWYGDSACSINPIGELYKTEVRQLATYLGIPDHIIKKIPTADLWPGQTDEGEIGLSYDEIDRILMRLVDDGVTSIAALEKEGFNVVDISRVVSLINRNTFKRYPPDIAPLGRKEIPRFIELGA